MSEVVQRSLCFRSHTLPEQFGKFEIFMRTLAFLYE